jgi:hypothetical protein
MDSHDERMNPRRGQEPAPRSAEASAHPIREPVGSGPAQDTADSGEPDSGQEGYEGYEGQEESQDPREGWEREEGQAGQVGQEAQERQEAQTAQTAQEEGRELPQPRQGQAAGDDRTGQDSRDDRHIPVPPAPAGTGSAGTGPTGTGLTGTDRPPSSPTGPATDAAAPDAAAPAASGQGIGGLSLRYQVAAAVALAAIAVAACVHLALVFLSVAPSNTMTKQHGQMVDDWVLPEFEQNWKLFAPNPLQQNIAVQARAEVRSASGGSETTGWYDISALDGAAIDGNPLPSHTQQNELRRAWDFFVSTHDGQNHPIGMRGELSESYLRRIIVLRLHRLGVGTQHAHASRSGKAAPDGTLGFSGNGNGVNGTVVRLQIRSMTTNVQPPRWSGTAPYSDKPVYRTLAWWPVTADDMALDAAAGAPRTEDTTTEAISR